MFGIEAIDFWHWWVLAVALFILEKFSPAALFIWIGIAAGFMGLLLPVGRVFEVKQAIVDGTGRVRVGDTTWKVSGPDAGVGEKVKVVGIDSAVLRVERAE